MAGAAERPESGRWTDRGDTIIYDSEWVRLVTTDVVLPDGTRLDHHVVRMPRPAAGTIMISGDDVLLLWRHRFITDTWGWEIPAGTVDDGESPHDAAIREALEETGWRPASIEPLCRFNPANGVLDHTFHIFISDDAVEVGSPTDINEAERIDWVPITSTREFLIDGQIVDGLSFAALSYAFAAGAI